MDFSVVIPTYNRCQLLERTLHALAAQKPLGGAVDGPTFEVLVVDDGSTDSTRAMVEAQSRSYPVHLRYFFQKNRKQGAARNLGASVSCGDYLLFLGDDVVPSDSFLSEHRLSHRDDDPALAVIGYTRWPEDLHVTPFLEYIGEKGWQFGFSLIEDPHDLPFNFFYTSNLSLPRSLFQAAGGFDESFREYGWEDVELGWRLKKAGMRLSYNAKAIAYHYHPTSLSSFVRRQRRVGRSAWTFYRRHPEMEEFLNIQKTPHFTIGRRVRMWLLTRFCTLSDRLGWPDLSAYYPDLMSYHYQLGILEGQDDPA